MKHDKPYRNRRGLWPLVLALALGCKTERQFVDAPDASVRQNLPDDGPEPDGLLPSPALSVTPQALELGAIAQGAPARARLRVANTTGATIPVPRVEWSSDSDPAFSVIQNLCTEELSPAGECELRVQVVPSRVGALSGLLTVSGADAVVPVPAQALGLAQGPLVLQPAPGNFPDFGGVQVGSSNEASFTLLNAGSDPSGALSFSFNRPEFSLGTPGAQDCAGVAELGPGESCTLRAAFAPVERGAIEAAFTASATALGSRTLSLRGYGTLAASLGVSEPLLSFGGVVPGDSAVLELELENRGDEDLTLTSPQIVPSERSVFRIAESNCGEGVVLGRAGRCRLLVDYRPVEEAQPSAAELVVGSADGATSARIALQGVGLTRGNLLIEPILAGEEDFGDVRLGERAERLFRVSNPAQQPSGALSLSTRNGFAIASLGDPGACESGVTELSQGQSCSVRVQFAPSLRGAKAGALTVDSPLAGARSLALRGRGVAPARLEVQSDGFEPVLDFGRVSVGSRAAQRVRLSNAGDELLGPPTLRVSAPREGQAGAFTYDSGCTQPLAAGQGCDVAVRFAPERAEVYAANVELLTDSGRRSSVLLLGEGQPPGRLVLAPAVASAPDFGDVPIGQSAVLAFTLTNPGGGNSGPFTLSTGDSQFAALAGGCAATAVQGLGDGESCNFEVSFTPSTNTATETRVSVQSSGGGESALALTGRGRRAAALSVEVTERDLGRANIGQPSGTSNQFSWTVRNTGDLPSGSLDVANGNSPDFDIIDSACGAPLAAAASCALTVAFAPDEPGDRTARITVTEASSGQAVSLQLTGFGVLLAGPGERCLATSDCREGVCTAGLCCDQACGRTCQSCASGQCLELNGGEPCGNSGGVCFGVEQCALPAGGGCTDSSECGGNLECKQCRQGGRQCTAPEACCGGCPAGYQCVGGACGCPVQADGQRQIDCGSGLCALNRAGACCPSSPPAGCNCDPSDNLCKECLQNSHCVSGPANSFGQCNANRTCSYPCQPGFKSCNGACIPNAQCCGGCGAGQQCVSGQCLINDGGTCSPGATACASGNCSSGRCCPTSCGGGGCTPQGSCSCPAGQAFARGACRRLDGQACTTSNDCVSVCNNWFEDNDGDRTGNRSGQVRSICGAQPPNVGVPLVLDGRDCCDGSAVVSPNQTGFFDSEQAVAASNACPDWLQYDFNCNDRLEPELQPTDFFDCEGPANLPCAQRAGIVAAPGNFFGITRTDFQSNAGLARVCGNSSVQYNSCRAEGASCIAVANLAPSCR